MNDDFPDISQFRTKSGWKIKPKLEGDPVYAKYVQDMARELRKVTTLKPRPVKPDGMSEADFIFSLQSNETQKIMELQKDPDYVRDWNAPYPENAQVRDKDGNVFINERSLSEQEDFIHGGHQRSKQKTINQLGQSELSGVDEVKREKGISAFMEERATLSVSDLIGIRDGSINVSPYDPPKPEWETIPAWKALWFKLIGKTVRTKQD